MSCSEDSTSPEPVEKVQLAKLTNTWRISSVTLDTNLKTTDFTDFTLTLAGTFNDSAPRGPHQYTVAGKRPSTNPWPPAGGSWSFGADPLNELLRHDTPDLNMNYTATDTQLTIRFSYVGAGFAGNRTAQVNGNWVFTFTR